jgi:hypothetical protein
MPKRFVVQVQHGNAVPLERARELVPAQGGDLQSEPTRLGVPASLEMRVHLARQVGDDGIRILLLGAGDTNLVFLRRLASGADIRHRCDAQDAKGHQQRLSRHASPRLRTDQG